jgi:quinol monooxygenase YgiN
VSTDDTKRAALLTVDFIMTLRPEVIDEFLTVVAPQELPATRCWAGNEGLTLYQDAGDPRRMILQMRWRARRDFDAYLQWRMGTGFVARLEQITVEPLQWVMLDETMHM